jgi:hypothetical protein
MEHSKRSAELCGWAVVYDGSEEGVSAFAKWFDDFVRGVFWF